MSAPISSSVHLCLATERSYTKLKLESRTASLRYAFTRTQRDDLQEDGRRLDPLRRQRFIEEVRGDEPALAQDLRIEERKLGAGGRH